MAIVHTLRMGMANAYLLEFDAGLLLVDSGSPHQEKVLYSKLNRLGRSDLKLIFIPHAHFDHFGSAAAIRRETGASVAVHAGDAEALVAGKTVLGEVRGRGRLGKALLPLAQVVLKPEGVTPDWILNDGDPLWEGETDVWMMHTPGHTPGSGSLLVDSRQAFVGDLLSTNLRPHMQQLYATDWAQIAPSLERIQRRGVEEIYPGHGPRLLDASGLDALIHRADYQGQR